MAESPPPTTSTTADEQKNHEFQRQLHEKTLCEGDCFQKTEELIPTHEETKAESPHDHPAPETPPPPLADDQYWATLDEPEVREPEYLHLLSTEFDLSYFDHPADQETRPPPLPDDQFWTTLDEPEVSEPENLHKLSIEFDLSYFGPEVERWSAGNGGSVLIGGNNDDSPTDFDS